MITSFLYTSVTSSEVRTHQHDGVPGSETTEKFARGSSVQKFVGPEPSLGDSRQNIKNKTKLWMDSQHLALRRGPCSTQRQTQELISGPSLATKA